MKISQVCAVLMLLAVASAMAFADTINDPQVIIHGAASSATCPEGGCKGVGLVFSFKIPSSGSGTLFFTNDSGQNWTSLALIEKGVPAADIKCHTSLFSICTEKTLKNGSVEIYMSVGDSENYNKGIKNGQSFGITFACNGGGCWPGSLSFGGRANGATIPEPGTLALLATGLGALISRRKLWKKQVGSWQ